MKLILILVFSIAIARAERFYKFVPSSKMIAECDASAWDERGPFGIVLVEKNKTHDFLVMTGVYYDTCKDLEKRINVLRRKHNHLLLIGTEGHIHSPTNRVWRWRSVRSPRGDECISYFHHDCPEK